MDALINYKDCYYVAAKPEKNGYWAAIIKG
jgi:hypothetical protein